MTSGQIKTRKKEKWRTPPPFTTHLLGLHHQLLLLLLLLLLRRQLVHHGAPSAQQQHLPRGQRRSRGRWRQALAHQTATSPQGRGAGVRLGYHELLLQGVHPLLRGVGGGVGCTTSPEVDGATTAVVVPRLRVLQAPAVEGGREGPVLLPAGGGARRVGLPPARVHRGLLLLLVLAG